jgi:hypothetical protein
MRGYGKTNEFYTRIIEQLKGGKNVFIASVDKNKGIEVVEEIYRRTGLNCAVNLSYKGSQHRLLKPNELEVVGFTISPPVELKPEVFPVGSDVWIVYKNKPLCVIIEAVQWDCDGILYEIQTISELGHQSFEEKECNQVFKTKEDCVKFINAL